MNRSRFSPLLENLDRTINLQEAFNSQHFMNELSDLMPKLLSGVGTDDPKDSLILSLHETLKQHRNFVEMMPIGLMLHRAGRIFKILDNRRIAVYRADNRGGNEYAEHENERDRYVKIDLLFEDIGFHAFIIALFARGRGVPCGFARDRCYWREPSRR